MALICQEKPSQLLANCNGLVMIKKGASQQIDGPSGADYNTDFMNITVYDNPNRLSLRDFVREMYHRGVIAPFPRPTPPVAQAERLWPYEHG
jgi:hypothetical protein